MLVIICACVSVQPGYYRRKTHTRDLRLIYNVKGPVHVYACSVHIYSPGVVIFTISVMSAMLPGYIIIPLMVHS